MISVPANTYLFKLHNRNTRKKYEICSRLTTNTSENVINVIQASLSLTLDIFFSVSIFDCEQINVYWARLNFKL